ncbi:spermidine/putrescine ABC transporter substrate-binding protein [Ferrimonas pelagia]|uniref:Spermidine/putrescine ABC transporter substrate-binding protein n=1 Tax=Ferrimonas pelagia TaxID=1177826 RepID=A0ABP9FEZ1_9GAMM
MRSIICVLLYLFSSAVQAETVRLYNWADYLAPSVIEAFEQETGHRVEQTFFDDEEVRDQMLYSGKLSYFDLVMIDNVGAQQMVQEGLLQPLTLPPSLQQHLAPARIKACGNHTIPYAWGTVGVAYRAQQGKPKTWREFFDPSSPHIQRVMHLSPDETLGVALLALGAPAYSDDPEAIDQAAGLIRSQPAQTGFALTLAEEQGAQFDAHWALVFSSDLGPLRESTGQQDWQYTIPDEGSLIWIDCLAAPAGHPIRPATQAFIEFINRPTIAAQNAELMAFATSNLAALQHATQRYIENTTLFTPPELLERSHDFEAISDEMLEYRNQWIFNLTQTMATAQ